MKPAFAEATETNALEDLGRATLQIVHDLKNQLNGLKLYATFLRKRLELDDRAAEERETLAKLIAGLDRAARDMTALVQYAQPLELRRQPRSDLRKIVVEAVREVAAQHGAGHELFPSMIEQADFHGEFDPVVLSQAVKAITEQAIGGASAKHEVSLHVRRIDTHKPAEALIEWLGVNPGSHNQSLQPCHNYGTVHTALAAKIIQSHGGRVESGADIIRAWLPLSE